MGMVCRCDFSLQQMILEVGVNYRSEIIMNAEGGDADFENVPNTPLATILRIQLLMLNCLFLQNLL